MAGFALESSAFKNAEAVPSRNTCEGEDLSPPLRSQIVGLVMARYVVGIEPLASMPPKALAAAVAPTYLLGPLSSDDR